MAITASQFRVNFPEFANITVFPDTLIQFWISVADLLIIPDIWGELEDIGKQLYLAHQLVIEKKNAQGASINNGIGGVPGTTAQGQIASQSADKVSVSFSIDKTLYNDAGFWNLTNYGTRYWQLLKIVGCKPIQVGIGLLPSYTIGQPYSV